MTVQREALASGPFLAIMLVMVAMPSLMAIASVWLRLWGSLAMSVVTLVVTGCSWAALIWLRSKADSPPEALDSIMLWIVGLMTSGGGVVLGGLLIMITAGLMVAEASTKRRRAAQQRWSAGHVGGAS